MCFQGGGGGGGGKDADGQQKAQQARQQEEAKHSILSQIMDQDARARCNYTILAHLS